ncbi:Methylase involved in ubiquinone/menaquinone biosynthesis [Variovorax sp. HW608]|uniref:class I SAM-dependent methyltransferase n=1 Tax=Variovorax sp. HW608 TaxID=1034889 RepID=UPI00081FD9A4|nr:class I SAM-dependent methyltransferase [Variovorax sp. HW608]SCK20778.1 Methylase involved in ubiquinone/menaquinone biosynthesis [Variovorax sp. HW608]
MDRSPENCFGIGVVLSVFLLAGTSVAQVATTANEGYRTHALREKAASEMGSNFRGALERAGPLVDSLGLHEGDTVADVGTGVGYLLPYIVRRIGSNGTIFAVDVYPEFLDKVRERIAATGWRNVHPVLGTERNPKLPANRLDAAILLDTYHHLNYPEATMRGVRRALKSDGRLFIIDFYRSRPNPSASLEEVQRHIRLDRDDVVKEVEAQGFGLTRQLDHKTFSWSETAFMYVLVFEKR